MGMNNVMNCPQGTVSCTLRMNVTLHPSILFYQDSSHDRSTIKTMVPTTK